VWARRNPNYEKKYEESIIKQFTDFGRGSSSYQEARGKIFGAGYEIYIIAFFIGLYFRSRKKLNPDSSKCKGFGQAIQYWGNRENRGFRKQYSEIQQYIFASLVARSDIDFIMLDKDKIRVSKAVEILTETMEEYANFGFNYIDDKMRDNPETFFKNSGFLDIFLSFIIEKNEEQKDEDVESLD
jgi:hypothetical protein